MLYALVCGIQRYIQTEGKRAELDFFVNPIFSELKLTLDAEMKHIGRLGVGTKKNQAEVISVEQEQLWSNRLLGDKSSQILKPCITFPFMILCFWLIKLIEFWILTATGSALSCFQVV